ncbi:MAG: class I SAM-dependent rRNA methyltransferase [Deltaproteobacteria bacterium]|nr:class I SAM-dependent rRNA methyltransferase [Deltaproteobacteria bacterium]
MTSPASHLPYALSRALPEWLARSSGAAPGSLLHTLHLGLQARQALASADDTDCCRLLDGEDGRHYVDLYANCLVVQAYLDIDPHDEGAVSAGLAELQRAVQPLTQALQPRAIWLKIRPRQTNTLVDPGRLAPAEPASGSWEGPVIAHENGLAFQIRPDQGLATGLYLDQRGNRRWLLRQKPGLRVLNTFCYSAGFSIAAARAGATTVSVDIAEPALQWARDNFALNHLPLQDEHGQRLHDLIRGDSLEWLGKFANRGQQFDLVILDPPSHASHRGKRWTALKDYPQLAELACRCLAPGGRLLGCINAASVEPARLHQWLRQGAQAAGRQVTQLTPMRSQVDYPSSRMKSALLTLA